MHELVIDGTPTGKRKDFGGAPPDDFSKHPRKRGWVWLPIETDNATIDSRQVLEPVQKLVEDDRIIYRRRARAKTAEELAAEARARRDPLAEIDSLRTRIEALEP